MKSMIEVEGYRAVVRYDSELRMYRGEFVGLNGGADFYAKDMAELRDEAATSLAVFLEMCREDGVEPRKNDGELTEPSVRAS